MTRVESLTRPFRANNVTEDAGVIVDGSNGSGGRRTSMTGTFLVYRMLRDLVDSLHPLNCCGHVDVSVGRHGAWTAHKLSELSLSFTVSIPFLWNGLFGNVLTTEDPLGISSEETASCGKFSVSLRDKSLVNDDIL